MSNGISHFSIHADDCARAKKFYEGVFSWHFDAWGPPEFWLIRTGTDHAVGGSLQRRREQLEGRGMRGFECTVAVSDVNATAQSVRSHGGTLLMEPYVIEHVGTLIQFLDTEGNLVNAMQYRAGVLG